MRHRMAGLLLLVVALAGLPSVSAAADAECAGAEYVESYDVTAEPRRSAYRMGQTAVVDIVVEDSVTGAPVDDVDAGMVVLGRGKKSPSGSGTTDAEGRATIRLLLHRDSVRPGAAHAFVGAMETVNTPAYCTGRYGQREYKRLFRIHR